MGSQFLAQMPLPAFLVQDQTILMASESFARLSGYSTDELRHLTCRDIFSPEDRPALQKIFTPLSSGDDSPVEADLQLVTKNGAVLTEHAYFSRTSWRGKPAYWGQLVDLTDLIKTRQEMDAVLADYKDLLENINDIVHIHTLDGRLIYINQAFEHLLGYKVQDWIGRSIFDLLSPRVRDLFPAYLEKVRKTGQCSGIMCLLDSKGNERYIKYNDTVQYTNGCHLVRGIAHDVTDQIDRARRLEQMLDGITLAMADMVEQRDPYTSGHQKRVAEIACTIGQHLKLSTSRLKNLFIAASLHDIGKISVPIEILSKPGQLTQLERKLIEQHPQLGAEILHWVPFPQEVPNIILCHHERLDGSGYPNGIKGEDIPLETRILSVCDVYEAMTTHRPYRPALSEENALLELNQKSGVLYDPEVVKALTNLISCS